MTREITPIRPGIPLPPPEGETLQSLSERIRNLQARARGMAREDVEAWIVELEMIALHERGIAASDAGYPAAVPDMARRSALAHTALADTLRAIMGRVVK